MMKHLFMLPGEPTDATNKISAKPGDEIETIGKHVA
jgi:hypothetical protein